MDDQGAHDQAADSREQEDIIPTEVGEEPPAAIKEEGGTKLQEPDKTNGAQACRDANRNGHKHLGGGLWEPQTRQEFTGLQLEPTPPWQRLDHFDAGRSMIDHHTTTSLTIFARPSPSVLRHLFRQI